MKMTIERLEIMIAYILITYILYIWAFSPVNILLYFKFSIFSLSFFLSIHLIGFIITSIARLYGVDYEIEW